MRMLTWELIGAVIGAGFASGQEIAVFFAQYGVWGYAGIFAAVGTILLLACAELPQSWRGRWPEQLWHGLLNMLTIAVGGAMLSAAGEVAARLLPVKGAALLGSLATLALAWFLACRSQAGLSLVSRLLLGVMAVLLCTGFAVQPMRGVMVTDAGAGMLTHAMAYGGFNAALQWPLTGMLGSQGKRRSVIAASLILLALLMLGNGLLLRHPALIGAELPFLQMLRPLGRAGYALCVLSLYLAALSSLTACIRAQRGRSIPVAVMAAVSLLGFSGVIDAVYPVLGGACALMLLLAKITNCLSRAFLSRRSML